MPGAPGQLFAQWRECVRIELRNVSCSQAKPILGSLDLSLGFRV